MLRGDRHSEIPYFTKFGQDDTPHPLVVALAKLAWEVSGAKDFVKLAKNDAPPGTLLGFGGMRHPPRAYPVGPKDLGLGALRLPVSPFAPVRHLPQGAETRNWDGGRVSVDDLMRGERRGVGPWPRNLPPDVRLPAKQARQNLREMNGSPLSYNIIRRGTNEVVGAAHFRIYPDRTHVDQVFLDKELRGRLDVLRDLLKPALERDKPITSSPMNPAVKRIVDRMASSGRRAGEAPVRRGGV